MVSVDKALAGAVRDDTCYLVGTCQHANLVSARQASGCGAAADEAVIASCKQGEALLRAFGLCASGQLEVADRAFLLDIAEKAGIIASTLQGKAADGMAFSEKSTAEGGNGRKIRFIQIDITVKHHDLICGPGIQHTVSGQLDKILRTGEMNFIFCSGAMA